MPNRTTVSSAEFIRNIGHWQNEALRQPISITHHGRERLVLAAPETFQSETSTHNEASLASLGADYAALLDNLDEGFLAFDAQLQVTQCNAIAAAFVGRAPDALIGASVFDAMPQPLASILADRLQRTQRSRKRERFEAGAFDGRQIEASVFAFSGGAAAVFHNITEQMVLRRRLEQAEGLDAAVQHHTRAAAIRLDARARIETVDDTFCKWSGFGSADVMGHRFVDLVSATERREVAETIERVLKEGTLSELSLTFLGKRGEELPCVLAVAPILTDFVAHGVLVLVVRNGRAAAEVRAA